MPTPSKASLQFLRDDQAAVRLKIPLLIQAIDDAFRLERDSYVMPPRMILPQGDRTVLVMPCFSRDIFGVKIVTMKRDPGRGHRVLKANYTLYDGRSGDALLFMEADVLTDLRTAATSAVATRLLARSDSRVLGIFGTGRQAKAHLTVFLHTFPFREVLICGSSPERSADFARMASSTFGVSAQAVDASRCASQADVLCTCTTSTTPLFDGQLLPPGCHINAVGAFRPDTRELDDETIVRSRIVVDTYTGAPTEAGEILIAQHNRVVGDDCVLADLHESLSGKMLIRRTPADITLFKSVGCALEDLAAARLLLSSNRAADVDSDAVAKN